MTGEPVFPTGSRPVIAQLDAYPDKADQLRQVITRLAHHVRAEPGCLFFAPYEQQGEPGHFYIYEVYASTEAFDQHMQTPHVRDFMGQLPELSPNGLTAVRQLDEIVIPKEAA